MPSQPVVEWAHGCYRASDLHRVVAITMTEAARTWAKVDGGACVNTIAEIALEVRVVIMETEDVRFTVLVKLWIIVPKAG